MTSGSPSIETISHRALTGTPNPSRIIVTGWGAKYSVSTATKDDWSDDGRFWCKVESGSLKVYKRIQPDGTFDAADEVMRGTIAVGSFDLTEQNSSGLSGSIALDDYADGDVFDIIVTYADERDIERILNINDQASALDAAVAKILTGAKRWEDVLYEAKRKFDNRLIANGGKQKYLKNLDDGRDTFPFKMDARKRWELASVASPRQIADIHVYYALALLCKKRATFNSTFERLYVFYMGLVKEELAETRIIVDYDADQVVDTESKSRNPDKTLERG